MNLIYQIEFCASGVSRSQIATILRMLLQARGQPVAAVEMAKESGSLAVHSRICDLRKLGYNVRNTTQTVRSKRHSCYTLIGEPPDPPPTKGKARRIIKTCAPVESRKPARPTTPPHTECGTSEGTPSTQLGLDLLAAPAPPKWHDGGAS